MEPQDNKVYITNSSVSTLRQAYYQKIYRVNEEIKNSIYKEDFSWILSDAEFKALFAEILVFSSSKEFKLAENLSQRKDGGYLFKNDGPPKYHISQDCPYLNSDYVNYTIPPEIESKGPEAIEQFRSFAEANKHIIRDSPEKFLTMLEARFLLKNRPVRIERINSGSGDFSDLTIEEMEEAIEKHVIAAKEFQAENPEVKRLTYAPKNVIDKESTGAVHKKWYNHFKAELKSMLRVYNKKDKDLTQSETFLKSLGFEACKACTKNAHAKS